MNDILKFNVFGENFEIKTNDLENTNFIFNILGSNCKNNHIANKESYIFEYNFDNNYIPKIHKKGIKTIKNIIFFIKMEVMQNGYF